MKTVNLSSLDWVISNDYEGEMTLLGEGSFARVLKTFKKTNPNQPLAIKFTNSSKEEDFNQSIKEIENMAKVRGQRNIIEYYDFNCYCSHDKNSDKINYYVLIAMECADTSLEKILKSHQKLSVDLFHNVSFDIILALKAVHKLHVAHLDLNPRNILYFEKGNLFKLSDWAGAITSRSNKKKTILSKRSLFHSEDYSAPEILMLEDECTALEFMAADVYSVGITLLECLGIKLKRSMEWKLNKQSHDGYLNSEIFLKLNQFYEIHIEIRKMIEHMLVYEPENRCKIESALETIRKFAIQRRDVPVEPEISSLKNTIERLQNENELLEIFLGEEKKKLDAANKIQLQRPSPFSQALKSNNYQFPEVSKDENLVPEYILVEAFQNVIKAFSVCGEKLQNASEMKSNKKLLKTTIEHCANIIKLVKLGFQGQIQKETKLNDLLSQFELTLKISCKNYKDLDLEQELENFCKIISGK